MQKNSFFHSKMGNFSRKLINFALKKLEKNSNFHWKPKLEENRQKWPDFSQISPKKRPNFCGKLAIFHYKIEKIAEFHLKNFFFNQKSTKNPIFSVNSGKINGFQLKCIFFFDQKRFFFELERWNIEKLSFFTRKKAKKANFKLKKN